MNFVGLLQIVVAMTSGTQDASAAQVEPESLTPFRIQFVRSVAGMNVEVLLDGQHLKTSSAGRLYIRSATNSAGSYCGDIRSPMRSGQYFSVVQRNSKDVGGNIAKAGNIVAAGFHKARTQAECAALQLAIWEAVEDGGKTPDFSNGHFAVRAPSDVLALAGEFYKAVSTPAAAIYLQTGGDGQSQFTAF